jgi:hypothetical protein
MHHEPWAKVDTLYYTKHDTQLPSLKNSIHSNRATGEHCHSTQRSQQINFWEQKRASTAVTKSGTREYTLKPKRMKIKEISVNFLVNFSDLSYWKWNATQPYTSSIITMLQPFLHTIKWRKNVGTNSDSLAWNKSDKYHPQSCIIYTHKWSQEKNIFYLFDLCNHISMTKCNKVFKIHQQVNVMTHKCLSQLEQIHYINNGTKVAAAVFSNT